MQQTLGLLLHVEALVPRLRTANGWRNILQSRHFNFWSPTDPTGTISYLVQTGGLVPDCKIGGTNSSGPQELSVSGTFFLQTEGLAGSSSSPFFPLPSPTLPWLLRPEQPRLASVDTAGGVAQCPLVNPGTVAFCPEQTIFTTAMAAWRFLRVILSPGWSSCSYCCRDSDSQLRFLAVTLFNPPPELGSQLNSSVYLNLQRSASSCFPSSWLTRLKCLCRPSPR